MVKQVCLAAALLAALPSWWRAAAQAGDPAQMQIAPMVSGEGYSTETGSEEKSNFLNAGVNFMTAFDDNVLGAVGGKPVSNVSFLVNPSLSFNQTTPRQTMSLRVSPGFLFYEPSSELNMANDVAGGSYRYRLSPHSSVYASDSFFKTSGLFSQFGSGIGGATSGSPEPSPVVAPYASMMSNSVNGGFNYQFRLNALVGATGGFSTFSFPNGNESVGLSDSNSLRGSFYYGTRFGQRHYLGVTYSAGRTRDFPKIGQSQAITQSVEPFYSILITPHFSVTGSVGPQYVDASDTESSVEVRAWTPSYAGGIGLQAKRASFSASFLHAVTGGTGLGGAFRTTSANGALRLNLSNEWSMSASTMYQIQKNAAPGILVGIEGGHTMLGGFSFSRRLGERFHMDVGYERIHQLYPGVSAIDQAPDNNHEFVSIGYAISRPLGR